MLFIAFVLLGHGWRRAAGEALVVGAVSLLVVAPWTVRNWRRFGRFVLISTNGGLNLWIGNNPASSGGHQETPIPPDVREARDEAEWDARIRRHAVRYIVSHPGLFVRRTVAKLSHTVGFGFVHAGAVRQEGWVRVALRAALSALATGLLVCTVVQGLWTFARIVGPRSLSCAWALLPLLFTA